MFGASSIRIWLVVWAVGLKVCQNGILYIKHVKGTFIGNGLYTKSYMRIPRSVFSIHLIKTIQAVFF